MRITAGRLGGRTLISPPDKNVRPTSDKVRQAIFNVLSHNDFDVDFSLAGSRIIDLFAGTGALGIEALSRGASFVLFVDDSADSRATIRQNIESLHLTGTTKIWRRDATKLGPLPAGSGGPFDLALIDPPYRSGLSRHAIESLLEGAWLSANAIVVVERGKSEKRLQFESLLSLGMRSYGDTEVQFFGNR